ncbi:exopolysaccharide biosynthesis protein [Sulfitobacter sp. LCG007]
MAQAGTVPHGIEKEAGPGPQAMTGIVDRLHDLADGRESIRIDELTRRIGAQGHAPLLLVAAIFLIMPIGMVPGVGGALGIVIAAAGLQMLRGQRGIWIPPFMARRELPAEKIRAAAERIRPVAAWLRRRLRIRLETLARGRVSLTIIALLLMLSGGSMLVLGAIPVAAPIVGLPIAVFAFGILARDGYVVAGGYLLLLSAAGALFFADRLFGG